MKQLLKIEQFFQGKSDALEKEKNLAVNTPTKTSNADFSAPNEKSKVNPISIQQKAKEREDDLMLFARLVQKRK